MESADGVQHVALFVGLNKSPCHVFDLRLNIPWVFQEVTQVEEKFGLHAAHKIGKFVVSRPALS